MNKFFWLCLRASYNETMGGLLSSRSLCLFVGIFMVSGWCASNAWATEELCMVRSAADAISIAPVSLGLGEAQPLSDDALDQVAGWMRRGAWTRTSDLLEARLDAADEQHCRQRILTAVARVEREHYEGVDALLAPCKTDHPVQPHLDLLAARAACGEGDIRLMYKRLWRVRKALDHEDAEILAKAEAMEIQCLIEHRSPGVALRKVEAFLKAYPEAPMFIDFEFARIQLLERTGKQRLARSLATEFVIRYPRHRLKKSANEFLARMSKRDKKKRKRARSWKNRVDTARHLVRHKEWETVDVEVDALEAKLYGGEVPPEWVDSVEGIVLVYLRHRSAFERAENLVLRANNEKTPAVWERVLSYRASQGDLEGARRALKKIPMHRNKRQQRLFELLVSFGEFGEARDYARQILERKRRPEVTFLFKAALAEWLGGDLDLARAHLERCIKRSSELRARFFYGLVLRDQGKIEEAVEAWWDLVDRAPEGYYGVLAESRLSELGQIPTVSGLHDLLPLQSSHLQDVFDVRHGLLRGEVHVRTPELDIPPTTAELFDGAVSSLADISPRLLRAQKAYQYGMFSVVQGELRTAAMEFFRARRARGQLRAYIRHTVGSTLDNRRPTRGVWGQKRTPRRIARNFKQRKQQAAVVKGMFSAWTNRRLEAFVRLLDAFDEPMLPRIYALYRGGGRVDASPAFQKWAYPMPWRDATEMAEREAGVPAVLLHTVMNIESAFYARAVSRAGARGLFQIMPQTAARLAHDLGEAPPNLAEMLTREVSLRYGSQYLARLLEEFQDQIPLVLAGYNAGPHHVKNWLRQRGEVPLDVFVELIPFAQARGYVKKGIARLTSTLRVHSGTQGLYIPRKMDPKTAGQLDY